MLVHNLLTFFLDLKMAERTAHSMKLIAKEIVQLKVLSSNDEADISNLHDNIIAMHYNLQGS